MEFLIRLVIQCLSPLILFSTTSLSLTPHLNNIPPFTSFHWPRQSSSVSDSAAALPPEFETYYYNQTLDHFNYAPQSYATFSQRYIVNSKYWGGAQNNAPIFAWLGLESPVDRDPLGAVFLTHNAPRFNALLVYIEHRFYGESVPFGTQAEALNNETLRGYFNSAQALADYAEVLLYIKNAYGAQGSPIIVVGASYGGMLAAWFRLKYPHIAMGALASSAPLLYFDDITPQNGYYDIVTKDFRDVSESCVETIKESWSKIYEYANQTNGLYNLSRKFNLCKNLTSPTELRNYLHRLYSDAAQYDNPPEYPVRRVCGGIDGAPEGSDILDRIQAGVVAYEGVYSCYIVSGGGDTVDAYAWQACSEIVYPIQQGNDSMFIPTTFNLQSFSQNCINTYGVPPRPHWVTTYYGGHDFNLVLKDFGSNIIFSNGLRDPYSIGGVLKNISDTLVAVYTQYGAHVLDLYGSYSSAPSWLTEQRETEVKIIQDWITKYYADLQAFKK
ncbi:PREDICTED: lysosomal Pro-X carboxypeptidase-like [Ipomoea nil]|uniref:lysosomal Pro-X carboxypeptidase-like n=1 Tax=Ipomoea nil TaxID=35883 RepID=UPI0009014467|nr:PREDICTED: lysosomal Pro-X carboxypeptidase-like [Ipomoea nil]